MLIWALQRLMRVLTALGERNHRSCNSGVGSRLRGRARGPSIAAMLRAPGLALLALLALAAPAQARTGPALPFGDVPARSGDAGMAMAPDGTVVVARFSPTTPSKSASARRAARSRRPSRCPTCAGEQLGPPRLAADDRGGETVAFSVLDLDHSAARTLARHRDRCGPWQAEELVSDANLVSD